MMTEGFAVPGVYDVRADDPVTATPGSANGHALYWSVRGEVACAQHVPRPGSDRWSEERWAEVPSEVGSRRAIRYQCQHCADSKTPIVHQWLNTHVHR